MWTITYHSIAIPCEDASMSASRRIQDLTITPRPCFCSIANVVVYGFKLKVCGGLHELVARNRQKRLVLVLPVQLVIVASHDVS